MSGYDLYIFILCAIVFVALTALLTYLVVTLIKMHISLIRLGEKDSQILESRSQKKRKAGCVVDCVVSFVMCGALLLCFGISLYINLQEDTVFENIPTYKVVRSNSMSKIHKKNTYLTEEGIYNQFDRFDLILTYKKPAEQDLKQYDIVVYQQDDLMVVHRIVGIEEPNKDHPDCRYFLCKGDANEDFDRFPVVYDQIKGIYRGEKVPFVGSFILFMQAPAGWLCVLLVLFAMIATPIAEKKIREEEDKRMALLIPDFQEMVKR